MKQDVIKFLANPPKNESEKFNKAVSLYRQSKDHDVTLVRFLNSMGFSKDRLENVLYELKKLHSVTDLEIANARPKKEKVIKLDPEHEEIKAELKEFDVEAANYHSLKSMAAKVSKLTKKEPEDLKGDTLKPFVQDAQNEFFPPEPENENENDQGDQKDAKDIDVKDPVTETGDSADDKKDVSTPLDVTKEGKTDETGNEGEGKKDDGPSEEFKKKLAGFDTDAEKYNSIKSFAAEVSEVIKADPKNQKGDTLKAFIQEAKKKYAES